MSTAVGRNVELLFSYAAARIVSLFEEVFIRGYIMSKTMCAGLFVALSILMSGCSVAIKPGAEKITINKADPDPKCVEVGSVRGSSGVHDLDSCKNEMRNKALDLCLTNESSAALEGSTCLK